MGKYNTPQKLNNVIRLKYVAKSGLWVITKIMGHLNPEETLKDYIHTIDFIYEYLLERSYSNVTISNSQAMNLMPKINTEQSLYKHKEQWEIKNGRVNLAKLNEYLKKKVLDKLGQMRTRNGTNLAQ